MLNPLSWSLDDWFLFLQIAAFAILGATVAVGYFLSKKQAKENLELRTKLANAERRLLETQERMMPRAFYSDAFGEALKGKASGQVVIRYDPNALDAYEALGMVMVAKLGEAGWTVVGPMLPATPTGTKRIRPGITIEGGSDISECERRDTPNCSLWRAFKVSGLEPFQLTGGTEMISDLPEGAIGIVIGPRPLLPLPPAEQ